MTELLHPRQVPTALEEPAQILEIKGGQALNGTVPISGAKNAVLVIMAGAVLCNR